MSPTARSLEYLREQGYTADVVERWLQQAFVRKDWGGFGDVLACRPGSPILMVQTTSASNLSARYWKTIALPAAETWLRSGGAIELHGWSLRGPRGKRKLWDVTVKEITLLEVKAQNDTMLCAG